MSMPTLSDLTSTAQQTLLSHVGAMIRAAVDGDPAPPLAGECAALAVAGTFISLKRGHHLRSCCGGLHGAAKPLGELLPDAVHRAVYDDPRFPPVSPTELPYLDVEVWLLGNLQRVACPPAERAGAIITGGKHGVVIRWRDQSGLLLPGVAAEHGWDATTFLDHVCLKAGLHPSRWRDAEAALTTFEGVHFRGPVMTTRVVEMSRLLRDDQVAAYADFSRRNVGAILFGGTPHYAAAGLPDGTVSGLIFSFDGGADAEPWHWSRLDLQRGLPFQAALFQLTQTVGQSLARHGASEADIARLGLSVLYDPAMHGTLDDFDLRGFSGGRRALALMERGRCAIVFDGATSPDDLLERAADRLQVRDPATVSVFSLAVDSSQSRLLHTAGPRALAGPALRPPAVAGSFYPSDPHKLRALVEQLLHGGEYRPESWAAAMVPHAGLAYSGSVAAAVFRRLRIPETVIIIGPKHTPHGMDWAVMPQREWLIPGARLAADPSLAQRLAAAVPGLELDAAAHQQEHGIEVELPFLARLAPQSKIVGITIGPATLEECRRIAAGLAEVIAALPAPPLLLISSDMNHFANDAETRALDELALGCLDQLDAAALYSTCKRRHITMCGVGPAVIVLETLRRLGRLQHGQRVAYATSGDISGDRSRVVGYAGMLFG